MSLVEIEAQLKEPFALEDIDLKPQSKPFDRDGKTLCMAVPFADPRVYQDRLNALAYGEWSTPPPIAVTVGQKLICYVTVVICGVPHTDVGEADPGENQGTEAYAQGFKRACSQFGLGRYFYSLDKAYVPYNKERKTIDLDYKGRLSVVRGMYQKAGITVPGNARADEQLHELTKPGPARMGNGHQDEPGEPKQSDNLTQLVKNARTRAYKLSIKTQVEFETFCEEITGKKSGHVLVDIARINGELTEREKAAAKGAA